MQPGAQGWVFTVFTVHLNPGEKLLQKREQYFRQCSRMSQGGRPSSHPHSCPHPAPAALPAGQCPTIPAWGWLDPTFLDQSNHYRSLQRISGADALGALLGEADFGRQGRPQEGSRGSLGGGVGIGREGLWGWCVR